MNLEDFSIIEKPSSLDFLGFEPPIEIWFEGKYFDRVDSIGQAIIDIAEATELPEHVVSAQFIEGSGACDGDGHTFDEDKCIWECPEKESLCIMDSPDTFVPLKSSTTPPERN